MTFLTSSNKCVHVTLSLSLSLSIYIYIYIYIYVCVCVCTIFHYTIDHNLILIQYRSGTDDHSLYLSDLTTPNVDLSIWIHYTQYLRANSVNYISFIHLLTRSGSLCWEVYRLLLFIYQSGTRYH